MASQLTANELGQLKALDATYSIRYVGSVWEEGPTGRPREKKPGHVRVDIIDIPTDTSYATGTGDDERSAIVAALKAAETADKPMTPAQRLHTSQVTSRELSDENARLRAELEEIKAQMASTKNARPESPATTSKK